MKMNDRIRKYNQKLIQQLNKEQSQKSFEDQWKELDDFRESLLEYVDRKDDSKLCSKVSVLDNGHILDHHVLGYFAPMHIARDGFKSGSASPKRTPVEQLIILRDALQTKGIRLVYVPLPCKLALFPEIAVDRRVIPDNMMMIPQWRNMIFNLAKAEVEIVDCYTELKMHDRDVFSKNHHISPVGAKCIADKVADYLQNTMSFDTNGEEYGIQTKKEIVGSSVLLNSGNNNSIELGCEYFETTTVRIKDGDRIIPYMGRDSDSDISIIGDCNLQCYRGTGSDLTAQLSGNLSYPVRYLGRYLPFAKYDSIDKLPTGSLERTKVLVYIGFVSAAYVRATDEDDVWCISLPNEDVYGRGSD